MPIIFEELAEHSEASRRDIGRVFRWLSRELSLSIRPESGRDYLSHFCRRLACGDIIPTADDILRRAEAKEVTDGRSPTGLAAAAIYIASRQHQMGMLQKDIAEVAGVTKMTIRKRYKELVDQFNLDI